MKKRYSNLHVIWYLKVHSWDDRWIEVQFQAVAEFVLQSVQTDYWAHPAS